MTMETCEFLHGERLSAGIRAILREPGARAAVAFWGGDSRDWLEAPDARIVCDLGSGSTNPSAIEAFGDRARQMDALHAKVYIGADHAVVTSANASANGLGLEGVEQAFRSEAGISTTDNDEVDLEDDEDDGDSHGGGGGGGDVDKGHGLSVAKLTPVIPDPKPLAPITTATLIPRPRRKAPQAKAPSQTTQSLEEEEQKRVLKQEHYGYHCQACLGATEVLKAAPPGTYVFAPGYRQRFLHAHHVQHRQNGGALGAGNLLVLCEYHHGLFGDRLSRDLVLAALATSTPIRRAFPEDEAGERLQRRAGLLATIPLSAAPFEARLYFPVEHVDAWRSQTETE